MQGFNDRCQSTKIYGSSTHRYELIAVQNRVSCSRVVGVSSCLDASGKISVSSRRGRVANNNLASENRQNYLKDSASESIFSSSALLDRSIAVVWVMQCPACLEPASGDVQTAISERI